LGYPNAEDEIEVLDRQQFTHPLDALKSVVSTDEVIDAQKAIQSVFIAPAVKSYIVDIVQGTRSHPQVYLGASPRGSLALYRASQARAAMQKRDYVLPDDVKDLAIPTLSHRIIMGPGARLRDVTPDTVVQDVMSNIVVPGGDLTAK
jgi:MoxR-like ATPase